MTMPSTTTALHALVEAPRRKGLLLLELALLAVVAVSSFGSGEAAGRPSQAAKASPVWQLDLQPFGFVRPKGDWQATNASISFTSGETVVPAWLSSSSPAVGVPSGGTRGQVPQQRLEALFLDAATGKVRNTKEWPIGSRGGGIIPAGAGRFIVTTADYGFTLYSPTFDQLLRFEAGSTLSVSPDGKTILVKEERGPSLYTFRWIDLGSLQVLRSWDENGRENAWKGAEDINLFGGATGPIYDDVMILRFQLGFLIRTLDAPWQLVRVRSWRRLFEFQFVNRELLAGWFQGYEYHGESYFSLIGTDGAVLLEREFSSQFLRRPEISADGRRIALPILKGHGGSEFLDIAQKYSLSSIQVYDVAIRRWIYTLRAKDAATERLGGLGISPDGSLLALISQDGVLRMFKIPPPSSKNELRP
jgi:hypothetical protein